MRERVLGLDDDFREPKLKLCPVLCVLVCTVTDCVLRFAFSTLFLKTLFTWYINHWLFDVLVYSSDWLSFLIRDICADTMVPKMLMIVTILGWARLNGFSFHSPQVIKSAWKVLFSNQNHLVFRHQYQCVGFVRLFELSGYCYHKQRVQSVEKL